MVGKRVQTNGVVVSLRHLKHISDLTIVPLDLLSDRGMPRPVHVENAIQLRQVEVGERDFANIQRGLRRLEIGLLAGPPVREEERDFTIPKVVEDGRRATVDAAGLEQIATFRVFE